MSTLGSEMSEHDQEDFLAYSAASIRLGYMGVLQRVSTSKALSTRATAECI
jgi:hypothetical protein